MMSGPEFLVEAAVYGSLFGVVVGLIGLAIRSR